MYVNDFIGIMSKVKRFKERLEQEGIRGQQKDIILKIYIQDMTNKINTKYLKVV